MRGINKLTPLKINSLKAPGKYADGLGLYLLIRRPGDKSWCFRYMRNGHARQLGLGPLHSVSLQEARNRAREARQLILDGRDPIEVRQQALQAHKAEQLRTQAITRINERLQWGSTLES